jgi:hypothetical protein
MPQVLGAVQAPGVEGFDVATSQLDVLLRHRLRSISRRGGSTKGLYGNERPPCRGRLPRRCAPGRRARRGQRSSRKQPRTAARPATNIHARMQGNCRAAANGRKLRLRLLISRSQVRSLHGPYSGHPIGARGWGSGEGSEQAESVMQEPWPLDACPDVRARHLPCRDDGFFPADLSEWSPGNAWAPPQMRSRAATPPPSAARKYLPTDSRFAARSGRSQPASGFAREQRHQLPLPRPTWFLRG